MPPGKLPPMKPIALITALALALTAAMTGATGAADSSQAAPLREFEGRVVSVNREAKRFRLHDAERGTVRIRVTGNTRFERIDGLAGLRAGMRGVEAKVRRSDGRWVAVEVERSGGGGEHGGSDD
jgi:Domain of unknown function (DUF5666)